MEKITYPDGEEINYGYDYGGNVSSVKGKNRNADFTYVDKAGYDEFGQRAYMKLGNGVETRYEYDENRRWLKGIQTVRENAVLQGITYSFDAVGNVLGYANKAGGYETEQKYTYDGLYQLTGAEGESKSEKYGLLEYMSMYSQEYQFDGEGLGNMTMKHSDTVNTQQRLLGDPLKYDSDYEYEPGYAHRAKKIGTKYYRYNLNGSVTGVQDRPFEAETAHGKAVVNDLGGGAYSTEGGWALNEPKTGGTGSTATQQPLREYRWDERNRLQYSNDERYGVRYAYGEDGERTGKWATSHVGGESETLYFGKLWSWHYDGMAGDYTGMNSKHVFLGETRIATKAVYADGSFIEHAQKERQYYYHSDHLGSAQLITDYKGDEYERIEYTPYGELWIEKAAAASALDVAYRFTGKELDRETGLYYYGARYLDPRESRWLSVDPAMGEYIPSAPVDDEAKKRNGNLPGMGGVFNTVNLHVYHYAGNNPVKYVDPDGNIIAWEQGEGVDDEQMAAIKAEADKLMNSGTEAGRRFKELHDSEDVTVTINVNARIRSVAIPGMNSWDDWNKATNGTGVGSYISINPDEADSGALLAHEVSGHAYDMYKGTSPYHGYRDELYGENSFRSEQNAVAMENEYGSFKGLNQRDTYGRYRWAMPTYNKGPLSGWTVGTYGVVFGIDNLIRRSSVWKQK